MPRSVFWAVRLMYAGAALAALTAIVVMVIAPQVGVLRIGATSIVESLTRQVVTSAFLGTFQCVVWLWMAWKNKSGRGWARVVSTVFFACYCLGAVEDLRYRTAVEVRALLAVSWLVALGATIQLWRAESGPFYQESPPLVEVR
jgi:hypothetical protein